MKPTIPLQGLDEIRRVWAGRGGILAGVAAVQDDTGEEWPHDLTRACAARVLLEVLRPHLLSWPNSAPRMDRCTTRTVGTQAAHG